MKKTLASLLCLALAAGLASAGCGQDEVQTQTETQAENNSDVIKIGLLESVTGVYAEGASEETAGVEFAQSQKPTVTVDGKEYTIELVKADDESDREKAAEAAEELIDNEGVIAILGSYSSVTSLGAAEVIKEKETPAVGISCTADSITKDNDLYFRVCGTDSYQGAALAQYAYESLGTENVGIIYDAASDYSAGLAYYFTNEFKALTEDDSSAAEASYQTGDTDFTSQIEIFEENQPDCFFIPGNYTEAALLIKQLRKQGIETPVLGGDSYETESFLETGGSDVNGVLFSAFFDPSIEYTDKTADFVDGYEKAAGKTPSGYAALGYDAYMLICESLENCSSADRTALKEAIANAEYEGVTGVITFDENGNALKSAVIKKVNTETGTFDYVTDIPSE